MLLSTTLVGFVLTLSCYESKIKTLCELLACANIAIERQRVVGWVKFYFEELMVIVIEYRQRVRFMARESCFL